MSAPPRPTLAALEIADPPERWSALGFAVAGEVLELGGIELRLGGDGQGITGWSVRGIAATDEIDGLAWVPGALPVPTVPFGEVHPNGALGLDHVVVTTPDFQRTSLALERAGMPLRRIRTVGEGELGFRQGFRRLGPAILELVEARQMPAGPASFWGLVVIVADVEVLAAQLGERVTAPKPAVQPGRRIATLRSAAGLSCAVAFMDREPEE